MEELCHKIAKASEQSASIACMDSLRSIPAPSVHIIDEEKTNAGPCSNSTSSKRPEQLEQQIKSPRISKESVRTVTALPVVVVNRRLWSLFSQSVCCGIKSYGDNFRKIPCCCWIQLVLKSPPVIAVGKKVVNGIHKMREKIAVQMKS